MPTTTNYGWTTPADTDLVKDGASAIRTLGTAIDTTTFNNANAAIAKTIVDAKGDIIAATAADTVSRLAVGANDTVLTADSSTATGLKWAAAASGGANWSLLNSGGTALTGAATITVSGISGKDKIMVLVKDASSASNGSQFFVRINGDTGSNYYDFGVSLEIHASYQTNWMSSRNGLARTGIYLMGFGGTGAGINGSGAVTLTGCNAAGVKQFSLAGTPENHTNANGVITQGYYDSSSTVSSVSLFSNAGNFDNGTMYVYTSA